MYNSTRPGYDSAWGNNLRLRLTKVSNVQRYRIILSDRTRVDYFDQVMNVSQGMPIPPETPNNPPGPPIPESVLFNIPVPASQQDIDIAGKAQLDIVLPDLHADARTVLDSLQMGFLPVPPLNRKHPSTSFKVRGSACWLGTPWGNAKT